jgi:ribonuclease R
VTVGVGIKIRLESSSILTGASEKGNGIQLLCIPVGGKLVQGFDGVDVGEQLRVQLIETDVELRI